MRKLIFLLLIPALMQCKPQDKRPALEIFTDGDTKYSEAENLKVGGRKKEADEKYKAPGIIHHCIEKR